MAFVLVALVWISDPPSRSAPPAEAGGGASAAAGTEDVAGFRSDAWYLPDDELLGFVEIPGGPFLMGSDAATDTLAFDNERWADGRTPRTVDLPTFYIGRYEVTVAQFRAFAEATSRSVDSLALLGPPDYPVPAVAWTDALAYCRWLETMLKERPQTPAQLSRLLRDGWRVNLPSETEWEKAARDTDGRIYPWGNEPRRDRANYEGMSTMAVGSFDCPECPFQISDMSGNVWEWTRSPYTATLYDAKEGREDLEADALWVMRGGSFGDPARNVRAAIRGGADPGVRRPFIGFRVVLTRF